MENIPCLNKAEILVFFLCICPSGVAVYASCYYIMLTLHPDTYEYISFAAYGLIQFILGYTSGYFTSRWIYYGVGTLRPGEPPLNLVLASAEEESVYNSEEIPLLHIQKTTINPIADDTVEDVAA